MRRLIIFIFVLFSLCTEHIEYLDEIYTDINLKKPASDTYITGETLFEWTRSEGDVSKYTIEIAEDENFNGIVYSKNDVDDKFFFENSIFKKLDDKRYYWRVRRNYDIVSEARKFYLLANDIIYVDNSFCDRENCPEYGTKDFPYARINEAITQAFNKEISNVFVASGTYSEGIAVDDNINITGGFTVDDYIWTESDAQRTKIINDGLYSFNCSTNNAVENFTFSGTKLLGILNHSNISIRNCIFEASNGSYEGVINITGSSSPKIENCVVSSVGNNSSFSFGISVSDYAFPQIISSTVTANGSTERTQALFYFNNGGGLLKNCYIFAGKSDNITVGLQIQENVNLTVDSNYIFAKNDTNNTLTQAVNVIDSNVIIKNNPIIYVEGFYDIIEGISNYNSFLVVSNNYVYGINKNSNNLSVCISLDDIKDTYITNNIISANNNGYSHGIIENSDAAEPKTLENNLFYDLDIYYIDYDNGQFLSKDPSSELVSPVCIDNIIDITPVFSNDGDYRLMSITPTEIKHGGKNICGNLMLGDVCLDADGKARTQPFSIGAFEVE